MAQRIFSSHGAQSSQVRELNWNAQTIFFTFNRIEMQTEIFFSINNAPYKILQIFNTIEMILFKMFYNATIPPKTQFQMVFQFVFKQQLQEQLE